MNILGENFGLTGRKIRKNNDALNHAILTLVENPTGSKNSEILEKMPFLRILKSDKIYLFF